MNLEDAERRSMEFGELRRSSLIPERVVFKGKPTRIMEKGLRKIGARWNEVEQGWELPVERATEAWELLRGRR